MSAMLKNWLFIVSLLTAFPAWSINPDQLLRVDEAFKLSARVADTGDVLLLDWHVAEGYYLYRNKLKFSPLSENLELGEPDMPAGELKHDPNFGDVVVFHNALNVRLPVNRALDSSIRLKVGYQGCADVGVCYPPQTQIIELKLPRPIAPAKDLDPLAGLLQPSGGVGLNLLQDSLFFFFFFFQVMVRLMDDG